MRKLIAIVAGKAAVSLCSLLLLRTYSQHLSLSEIGVVTLLQNVDTFFGFVYASSYGNYLALTARPDQRNGLLLQRMVGYSLLSLLVTACFVPLIAGYATWTGLSLAFVTQLLFAAFLYFFHVGAILPSQLTVLNRVELSMALQVIKAVCGFAGVVVAFRFLSGVPAWVIGMLAGTLVPAVLSFYYSRKLFGHMPVRWGGLSLVLTRKALTGFLLPFAALQGAIWLFFNAYRIAAPGFFRLEFIGMLGLAFSFAAQFCFAFESVITQLFQGDFYRLIDEPDQSKKLQRFGAFLRLSLPLYVSFFVLGFVPYLLLFGFVVKAADTLSFSVLAFAWVFTCLRLLLNLFALLTTVLANPRFLLRHLCLGIVFLTLVLGGCLLLRAPLSERSFLLLLCATGSIVLLTLSTKISALTAWPELKIFTLLICLGLAAGGAGISYFKNPIEGSMAFVVAFGLSAVSALLLAIQVRTLPKKLIAIGSQ